MSSSISATVSTERQQKRVRALFVATWSSVYWFEARWRTVQWNQGADYYYSFLWIEMDRRKRMRYLSVSVIVDVTSNVESIQHIVGDTGDSDRLILLFSQELIIIYWFTSNQGEWYCVYLSRCCQWSQSKTFRSFRFRHLCSLALLRFLFHSFYSQLIVIRLWFVPVMMRVFVLFHFIYLFFLFLRMPLL